MTEEEFKAKVIGKKIGETPSFISETFSDESMPYFCVRSKDGEDFPLNLYSLCGYPKEWDELQISSLVEEFVNEDKNTKKRCLVVIVDKTYAEVEK